MLECSVKGNKNGIPTFPLKCPSVLLYAEYSILFQGTLKLKAIKYNFKHGLSIFSWKRTKNDRLVCNKFPLFHFNEFLLES